MLQQKYTRYSYFSAKSMIAQRQKLIKMADASELGWRVVNEYVTNPLASDSEDEKRIYKAEARATRKYKAEKSKKTRRFRSTPYGKQTPPKQGFEQSGTGATRQQGKRPPGLCFDCGKPGHWKGSPECTANHSNNKISIDPGAFSFNSLRVSNCSNGERSKYFSSQYVSTNEEGICKNVSCASNVVTESHVTTGKVSDTMSQEVSSQEVVTPVGRLKNCISKWEQATNSKYILDVVQNGYKLPLKENPTNVCLRNNKSARENLYFVKSEVQNLLKKGVVSKTDAIPYVVNPLTVAYNKKGKPRLVLDCRHINKCLHLFKIKFEDIRVAEAVFEENSYLYTWDLSSAYHHISISRDQISLLGFSIPDDKGNILYYVFNTLPFGIKTAGHIFTKLLKVAVTFLRAKGHKVIMFLDDGIGGHKNLDLAIQSSQFVKQTLTEFGFLLAHEKCNWFPSRKVTWLGHMIDMEKNMLFISDERIKRLQAKLDSVLFQIKSDKYNIILVKVLASVTGQIISLQSVIGCKVRLRTRELFKCINTRASWNAPVLVSDAALAELEFWKENLSCLSKQGKPLKDTKVSLYNIFADASAVGYGGYVECNWQNIIQLQNGEIQREVSSLSSSATISYSYDCPPEVENFKTDSGSAVKDHSCPFMPSDTGSICTERSPEVDKTLGVMSKRHSTGAMPLTLQQSGTTFLDRIGKLFVPTSASKRCENAVPVRALKEGSEVLGDWNEHEQGKSSTWRETEAVSRIIRSHAGVLKQSVVKIYADNKNVKSVLMNGSNKPDIQNIAINLNNLCERENIIMRPEWIPREENEKADYLSRCKDSDDWEIAHDVFKSLDSKWGSYTVDRFASHLNNKCKRFNSRWWVPGTEAIDALLQFWGRDLNWLVPPPRLIANCFGKMLTEKANGTLVIPLWKSSPFWPCLLNTEGVFKPCISEVKHLGRRRVIVSGKGNNGFFSKDPLPFDMLALKIMHY